MSMFEAFWLVLRLKQKYSKCCISARPFGPPRAICLWETTHVVGDTAPEKANRDDMPGIFVDFSTHGSGSSILLLFDSWICFVVDNILADRLWMAMIWRHLTYLNTFEPHVAMIWTHLKHRFASSQAVFGLFEGPKLVAYAMPWTQISDCPLGCLGNHGISKPTPGLGFSTSLCRSLSEIMHRSKRLKTADNQQSRVKLPWGSILVSFYLKKWPTGKIYETIMSSCNHSYLKCDIFLHHRLSWWFFPWIFIPWKISSISWFPRSPSLGARPEYVLKKTAPGLLAWQGDRIQPVEVAEFPAEFHHGKIQQRCCCHGDFNKRGTRPGQPTKNIKKLWKINSIFNGYIHELHHQFQ